MRQMALDCHGSTGGSVKTTMKSKILGAVTLMALAASNAFAVGTADADVATGIDNGLATWTLVKAGLISVAVALIGIRFLRKVR